MESLVGNVLVPENVVCLVVIFQGANFECNTIRLGAPLLDPWMGRDGAVKL